MVVVVPIVVMGVSGCGKSTVGTALARRWQVPFLDADDLHDPGSVAKMAAGRPLDDADRLPWLARIGTWLGTHPDGAVVACSALTRGYRDLLRSHCPGTVFIHLTGPPGLIAERLAHRTGHFMPPALLPSQLRTLEPLGDDEAGGTVDIDGPIDHLVARCVGLVALLPARQQDLT